VATDVLGQQFAGGGVVPTGFEINGIADEHRMLHVTAVIVASPVVGGMPQAIPVRRAECVEVVLARV